MNRLIDRLFETSYKFAVGISITLLENE